MGDLRLKQYLTTTVGLITSSTDGIANVMAAEWTYFVANDPLHIGIGLSDQCVSRDMILESGEFGVTLCDDTQADLADFVGSVSLLEAPKTSSKDLKLISSRLIRAPRVAGGVLSAECVVRQVVQLPHYVLVIGEAIVVDLYPENLAMPLVKHGDMYRLGSPLTEGQAFVAAAINTEGCLTIAGVSRFVEEAAGRVAVWFVDAAGQSRCLGEVTPDVAGDLRLEETLCASELRQPPEMWAVELRIGDEVLARARVEAAVQPPFALAS